MSKMIFMKRMKELRQNKGLSMDQFAKKLNVTKSRVNMWENSGSIPRSDMLIKIAEFYEVPTDYLLGNVNVAENPNNEALLSLQRNLGKLNAEELKRAESILKENFEDIFNDAEKKNDGF